MPENFGKTWLNRVLKSGEHTADSKKPPQTLRKKGKGGAAEDYQRYLQRVTEGDHAEYAYQRLVDWGFIKPPEQGNKN